MKNWNKKPVPRELVKEMNEKFGIDPISASILIRRGVTDSRDILYYLENDRRFLHNPFKFINMEDAVDRILQAQEEGEIVLIFGDRDVDGISSTTILYEQLKSMGIDVTWRLPNGNDGYGLSIEAIDDFYKNNGTLIITVDCGISNNQEIAYASQLGIDVIVLDHHNPPETLPSPAIIIDPKCQDSGYPFQDISGAAVTFKTVQALRFSKAELYKQEICLISVTPLPEGNRIDCLKIQNLVKKSHFSQVIPPLSVSISQTKLPAFLSGQTLMAWDAKETASLLKQTFGNSIEFNLADLCSQISEVIPQVKGMTLSGLKKASKIARYNPDKATEIEGFYNIFVTFINMMIASKNPADAQQEERDLQLVALAALADIMPLKNENRILVKSGIKAINEGKARPGLVELLSKLKLLGTKLTSTKLSWNVVPVLNATGRLGQPELGMKLFIEGNITERDRLADEIIELNSQRKQLGAEAWNIGSKMAEQSIAHFGGKLCVIIDENINRGVSGILAGRLVSTYNVPAMAVTFVGDTAIGSMRSCRGFSVTPFLDKMADIFINHGGHNQAAGFSFKRERLEEFKTKLEELYPSIQLSEQDTEVIDIDAELPEQYLKPDLLNIVDFFEPYGEGNPELTFLSQNLLIQDAILMGKPDPVHLKLTLDCGSTKWPAIFFGEAERLHRDFDKGDSISILYQIQRNVFNGNVTPQMILSETQRC